MEAKAIGLLTILMSGRLTRVLLRGGNFIICFNPCKSRIEETRYVFGYLRENNNDSNKSDLTFSLQSECLGGSHSAVELELRKEPNLMVQAREMQLATPQRRKSPTYRSAKEEHPENEYSSDEMDENQHVDDCPIKWYCRRRTKNGWGPCVAMRRHAESDRNQSGKKFRDRIPLEVKIGKISLNKREKEIRCLKRFDGRAEKESFKKYEIDPKVIEMQKKRLEAKLNWRPFQENCDGDDSESLQDFNSRDGYLRPRSALGGKAPVSILLFPYHQQSNCHCGRNTGKASRTRLERTSSAIQSTKPPIPMELPPKILRPKTTQPTGCGGTKSQKRGKRLQLPKQMDVLFVTPKKCLSNTPRIRKCGEKSSKMIKRSGEEVRKSQSFTSLYYELEDKSNSGRIFDDDYLEKMIRELSMEDNLRGIRNILNPGVPVKKKRLKEEKNQRGCQGRLAQWSDDDHFKIICKQVKFSQRRPKSKFLNCNKIAARQIEHDQFNKS